MNSCFDDKFQFEIEECSPDPRLWDHGGATHWRSTTETATCNYEQGCNDGIELAAIHPSPASDGAIREALVRRIELARKFIVDQFADPAQEPNGDWIAREARPAHDALCLALDALSAHAGDAAKESGGGYIDDLERSFDETPLADKMKPSPPDTHAEVKSDAYELFNRQEWFSLPMELRRRWWRETNYGSKPASPEIISDARRALAEQNKP